MRSLVLLILIFFCIGSNAQSLYMTRDVRKAFDKGTRSMDGNPGKNYWQNFGRYNITITAMPPDRTIKGTENITYINNSPDTLRNPGIKLFLNIHKPGAEYIWPRHTAFLFLRPSFYPLEAVRDATRG